MLQQRSAADSLIHTAHPQIKEILTNVSGVEYVMICSSDGFELTAAYKKCDKYKEISGCQQLNSRYGSSFLEWNNLYGCQNITLEAENGKAFLSAVPNKNHLMLIVALTSQEVLLGQLLFSLKRCSEQDFTSGCKLHVWILKYWKAHFMSYLYLFTFFPT